MKPIFLTWFALLAVMPMCAQGLVRLCGGELYVKGFHMCCDGEKVHSHWGRNECCGKVSYNPKKETCCSRNHVESRNRGCPVQCGRDFFNPGNEICCNGVPVTKPSTYSKIECCGQKAIDPRVQLCCDMTVIWKESKCHRCCGRNPYVPEKQLCCLGRVFDKKRRAYC